MTDDIRTATVTAIHDALAIRGQARGRGLIRTAAPETYMSPERLRLAKEIARHLPHGATVDNVGTFIEEMAAIVMRSARPDDGLVMDDSAGIRILT